MIGRPIGQSDRDELDGRGHVSRYETDIDLGNLNTSHAQVVDLVGVGKTVLDVGCATGDLARVLKSRACRVSGLEIDAAAAEKARPDVEELVIADLDQTPLSHHFTTAFDVIVFADVLEHLRDPAAVLRDARSLLAPEGRVVVSIPNVSHGSVRLALLQGHWRYTETGLLDRTHVRFFDRRGFLDLFAEAGYRIDSLRSTCADPLRVEVVVDEGDVPSEVIEWVRDRPDALNYQFVASARPAAPDEPASRPASLDPAVGDTDVRVRDRHWQHLQDQDRQAMEEAAQMLDLRHRVMTTRDAVVGLEASLASALVRVTRAEQRANRAEAKIERMRKRTAAARRQARRAERRAKVSAAKMRRSRRAGRAAREELDNVRRSRSWRLGRALTRPLRIFSR